MSGKMPDAILEMLGATDTDAAVFPPTVLYEEGWMLRLVLFAGAEGVSCLPFSFLPGSRWFSEALLFSPFLPRGRGDRLAETHTHVDGVVGHFGFTSGAKLGLELLPDSRQFVVIEAKMFSSLSRGTSNAPLYDQAARNVACMAATLERSRKSVSDLESIGFYVVAPDSQIKQDVFTKQMTRQSITEKVRDRINQYQKDREALSRHRSWFENTFEPLIKRIDLRCWSWETAVDAIADAKPAERKVVKDFYGRCLKHNKKAQPINVG